MKGPFHNKFFPPSACSNPHSVKIQPLGIKEKHHSWNMVGKRICKERDWGHSFKNVYINGTFLPCHFKIREYVSKGDGRL